MMSRSFQLRLKRTIDVVASAVGLIVLSPLLAFIAWRVRKDVGNPVLFRQVRPGKDGMPFTMVKFRTMRDAIGPDAQPLSDGERLTDFGRFLRRTSLDELPELWNVFHGDMSLVGPRPLLVEYLDLYTPEQMRRHDLRPGITGWAQINGRNSIGWEEKFVLDVWYVDHQSFWLDIQILIRTLTKVVRRDGINETGEVTMTVFRGDKL